MSGFYDVYVLATDRTADAVLGMFELVGGTVRPSFDISDPREVLGPQAGSDLSSWLRHMESHPNAEYWFYWNIDGSVVKSCNASFNADGGLILGVAVPVEEGLRVAEDFLHRLRVQQHARHGYVTWEEAPPLTTAEFIERARTGIEKHGEWPDIIGQSLDKLVVEQYWYEGELFDPANCVWLQVGGRWFWLQFDFAGDVYLAVSDRAPQTYDMGQYGYRRLHNLGEAENLKGQQISEVAIAHLEGTPEVTVSFATGDRFRTWRGPNVARPEFDEFVGLFEVHHA